MVPSRPKSPEGIRCGLVPRRWAAIGRMRWPIAPESRRKLHYNAVVTRTMARAETPMILVVLALGLVLVLGVPLSTAFPILPGTHAKPVTLSDPTPLGGIHFGDATAASGTLIVIGAPYQPVGTTSSAGRVYLFRAFNGAAVANFSSPNSTSNGDFGAAVAISGHDIVVGAPGVAPNGTVFVFSAAGKRISSFSSPCTQSCGGFGDSVAISGNLVAVGASGDIAPSASAGWYGAGMVRLYDAQTGALLANLSSPNDQTGGAFGYAVALVGTELVVGAPGEKPAGAGGTPGTGVGNVYVFNTSNHSLVATIPASNGQAAGYFGHSVAINGSDVVVGAPGETPPLSKSGAGGAFVFNASTGARLLSIWSPHPRVNGAFGTSVAISKTEAVVGAPGETAAKHAGAGRAYVFNLTSGALVANLTSPNAQPGGAFGSSVAKNQAKVVVGSPNEAASTFLGAGRAYLFRR